MLLQRPFNGAGNIGEADAPGEEKLHRHFVSRAEHCRTGSALFASLNRQSQAGKLVIIGRLKIEVPDLAPIEPGKPGVGQSFRMGQGILDGQAHIGIAQLRFD